VFQKLRCGFGVLWVMWASTVAAADWGHLRGRFVFDGKPPVRKPVLITADKEFCGNKNLLEEEVVVKPDSKGLANVAVWIYRVLRTKRLPPKSPMPKVRENPD
jgi:hypothetical protein